MPLSSHFIRPKAERKNRYISILDPKRFTNGSTYPTFVEYKFNLRLSTFMYFPLGSQVLGYPRRYPFLIRPSWSSWSPSRHEKVSGSMDVNPGWWSTENFAITAIVFRRWIDAWFLLWDSKNGSNQRVQRVFDGFCLPLITSKKERTFKGRWCWDG